MIAERADVVEERVDGEVAAERVLFGRAEGVVAMDEARSLPACACRAVADRDDSLELSPVRGMLRRRRWRAGFRSRRVSSCGLDLPPERGDLDGLGPELDVRQPEAPADDPAVAKQLLDLVRVRRGADVEVLRPASEQQVADAAADQIGDVVVLVQPVQDFERAGIDVAARDRVRGPRNDGRLHHRTAL